MRLILLSLLAGAWAEAETSDADVTNLLQMIPSQELPSVKASNTDGAQSQLREVAEMERPGFISADDKWSNSALLTIADATRPEPTEAKITITEPRVGAALQADSTDTVREVGAMPVSTPVASMSLAEARQFAAELTHLDSTKPKPRAFETISEDESSAPRSSKPKPSAFETTSEEVPSDLRTANMARAFGTASEEEATSDAGATKPKPSAFETTSEEAPSDLRTATMARAVETTSASEETTSDLRTTKRKPRAFETTSEEEATSDPRATKPKPRAFETISEDESSAPKSTKTKPTAFETTSEEVPSDLRTAKVAHAVETTSASEETTSDLRTTKRKPRAFETTSEEEATSDPRATKPKPRAFETISEDESSAPKSTKTKPTAFETTSEEVPSDLRTTKRKPRAFETTSEEETSDLRTAKPKPRAFETTSEDESSAPRSTKPKPSAFETPSEEETSDLRTTKQKPRAFETTSEEETSDLRTTKPKPHAFETISQDESRAPRSPKPSAFETTSEEETSDLRTTKQKPRAFETTSEEETSDLRTTKPKPHAFETISQDESSAPKKAKELQQDPEPAEVPLPEQRDEDMSESSNKRSKKVLVKTADAVRGSRSSESLQEAANKEACSAWLRECRDAINIDACVQYKGFCMEAGTHELIDRSAVGQTELGISKMAAAEETVNPKSRTAHHVADEPVVASETESTVDSGAWSGDVTRIGEGGFGTDKDPESVGVTEFTESTLRAEKEAGPAATAAETETAEMPEADLDEPVQAAPRKSAAKSTEPIEPVEPDSSAEGQPALEAAEAESSEPSETLEPVTASAGEPNTDALEEPVDPSIELADARQKRPAPRFGFTAASQSIVSGSEAARPASHSKPLPAEPEVPGKAAWAFGQAASTMTNNREVEIPSTTFELSRVDALGTPSASLGLAQSEGEHQHLVNAKENLCALWRSMCGRVRSAEVCDKYASICQ